MKSSNELFEIIIKTLQKIKSPLPENMGPETDLANDLELDSIDILDLSFELEKELNCSESLVEYLQKLRLGNVEHNHITIGELVNYLKAKAVNMSYITDIGIQCSIANNTEDFIKNLRLGKSGEITSNTICPEIHLKLPTLCTSQEKLNKELVLEQIKKDAKNILSQIFTRKK